MVDALHVQHVERALDVLGRPLLARMCDEVQSQLAAACKHTRELLRRVVALAAVQPDADEMLAVGQRLL